MKQEYPLQLEDFSKRQLDNGVILFIHAHLAGEIRWHPHENSLSSLFKQLQEFGEQHEVSLSPDLARIHRHFQEVEASLRREFEGDELDELDEEEKFYLD